MADESSAQNNTEAENKEVTSESQEKGNQESKTEQVTAEAKPVVPEKYEINLPKDSRLDKAHIEELSTFAKSKGLTQEQAQMLFEREHKAVDQFHSAQQAQIKEEQGKWVEVSEADKEIGGEHFKENIEVAKRVLERFGSDELRKALGETKFGDHPEVLRVFVRIGKAMADDKFVLGDPKNQDGKKSQAEILYGKKE